MCSWTCGVVGLVVRISAFQADGPGSIPGQRIYNAFWRCFAVRGFCVGAYVFVPSARLAQSVERQPFKLVVVGSSPTVGA